MWTTICWAKNIICLLSIYSMITVRSARLAVCMSVWTVSMFVSRSKKTWRLPAWWKRWKLMKIKSVSPNAPMCLSNRSCLCNGSWRWNTSHRSLWNRWWRTTSSSILRSLRIPIVIGWKTSRTGVSAVSCGGDTVFRLISCPKGGML